VKTDRPKLNWYKSAVLGPYKAGRNKWYENVFSVRGYHMLRKFVVRLEEKIFDQVFEIGGIELLDD
jgi:hypothetical protein